MTRSTGLRRRFDLHGKLTIVPHRAILGAGLKASQLPDEAVNSDLLPLLHGVGDQETILGCSGFTVARDLFGLAVAGATGQPAIFSGMAGYTVGRLYENVLDGLPSTTPLQDLGSDPAVVIEAHRLYGPVLEAEWPLDPAKVNDTGVASVILASKAGQRVPWTVGVFGDITGVQGEDLLNAICQALLPYGNGKHGRGVSIDVDSRADEFANATGDTTLTGTGAQKIDHSVSLIDYYTVGDKREFLLLNHWSTMWSPSGSVPGCVRVSEDYVLACASLGSMFHFISVEPSVPWIHVPLY